MSLDFRLSAVRKRDDKKSRSTFLVVKLVNRCREDEKIVLNVI